MGTTLVAALVREGKATLVNVGDSRGYRITGGNIRQITRDHSVVEELIQHGALTPEEARRHPQRNLITRALGTTKQVKADLFRETLEDGDAILLCSDGLVNEVTDQEILQEVLAGGTAAEVCHRLLDRALDAGASDNVTVVLFQV
jgi:protein phosphatase